MSESPEQLHISFQDAFNRHDLDATQLWSAVMDQNEEQMRFAKRIVSLSPRGPSSTCRHPASTVPEI